MLVLIFRYPKYIFFSFVCVFLFVCFFFIIFYFFPLTTNLIPQRKTNYYYIINAMYKTKTSHIGGSTGMPFTFNTYRYGVKQLFFCHSRRYVYISCIFKCLFQVLPSRLRPAQPHADRFIEFRRT